jgi:PIN domain nuclease of toxin-antitoxin system
MLLLDASAVIAFVRKEPGGELVLARVANEEALISTVNLTEVKGKLVGAGLFTPAQVNSELEVLTALIEPIPYSLEHAELAAWWYARKNPYNLSLGDCACLGTAEALGAEVMSAEQSWVKLPNLRVKVSLIRTSPV